MQKHHARIKAAEDVVELLENKFKVGPFKFGLDPIIGLFPVIGDLIPALLSSYLVWVAWQAKLDTQIIIKMISYIAIDYIVGSIPIIGDLFDFIYKAHTMNLNILKKELKYSRTVAD